MAVVSLYTVPACGQMTVLVQQDNAGGHRRMFCTCGWEILTLHNTKADIAVEQVEFCTHRQLAAEFGWDHPRGRIIAWVS